MRVPLLFLCFLLLMSAVLFLWSRDRHVPALADAGGADVGIDPDRGMPLTHKASYDNLLD